MRTERWKEGVSVEPQTLSSKLDSLKGKNQSGNKVWEKRVIDLRK